MQLLLMKYRSEYCKCGEPRIGSDPRCTSCKRESVYRSRNKRLLAGEHPADVFFYRDRKKNIEAYLCSVAKQSAKKRGLEFNITPEDINIPDNCPVFGFPLIITAENRHPQSPSIDRVDSSKGYVKGNIQIISWRANYLKGNGTPEEFKQLTEYLYACKRSV